jgi:hypothetical protein
MMSYTTAIPAYKPLPKTPSTTTTTQVENRKKTADTNSHQNQYRTLTNSHSTDYASLFKQLQTQRPNYSRDNITAQDTKVDSKLWSVKTPTTYKELTNKQTDTRTHSSDIVKTPEGASSKLAGSVGKAVELGYKETAPWGSASQLAKTNQNVAWFNNKEANGAYNAGFNVDYGYDYNFNKTIDGQTFNFNYGNQVKFGFSHSFDPTKQKAYEPAIFKYA